MAEQKTEDTKSPLARRVARPFAGPAGAAPAPSTPRPLARPAAPPARPGRAPFAPPRAPDRDTFGMAPTMPSVPPVPPSAAAPAFDITVSSPTPAAPNAYEPVPEPAIEAAAELAAEPATAEMDFGFGAPTRETDASVDEALGFSDAGTAPRRPVTSEMIAIDAFAAFDSVWGPGNTPAASPTIDPVSLPALDAESLGAAAPAEAMWADEITASPAHEENTARETSPVSEAHAAEAAWAGAVTPNSALPAWLMDDAYVPPAAEVTAPATAYEPTVEEYAPYVSMPDGGEPVILDSPVTPPEAPQTDWKRAHGLRVSATLDRLAERIRGGEIDVSSVAPEAPDAAVLASVLAALLGGSSRR